MSEGHRGIGGQVSESRAHTCVGGMVRQVSESHAAIIREAMNIVGVEAAITNVLGLPLREGRMVNALLPFN